MIVSAMMSVMPNISAGVSTSKTKIDTGVRKEFKDQFQKGKDVYDETKEGIKEEDGKC
jgi:hypothetical protein